MVTETKPHVTRNSGNNEWYTPSYIIEAAREAMGSIDCDPATSEVANRWILAPQYYTIRTNGLEQVWRGNVWLNPPYSRDLLRLFIGRLWLFRNTGDVHQACVLVNNATETAVGQELLKACTAACFFAGRISFWDEDAKPARKPLQGQVCYYFGPAAGFYGFKKAFQNLGVIMAP